MKVEKSGKAGSFRLDELTFNELVILRKSCEAYAKQGSTHAAEIAKAIESAMDDMTV